MTVRFGDSSRTYPNLVSHRLIPRVHESLRKLSAASQSFVFESMMSYVKEKLDSLPSFDSWNFSPASETSAFSSTPQGL